MSETQEPELNVQESENLQKYGRRNMWAISLAAFFNDMGSDLLFAFYPLFVIMILGQGVDVLGAIETVALLVGQILSIASGRLADMRGRKKLIAAGYGLLAVSRVSQGLSQDALQLTGAKSIYEIGRGIRNPPREALLAESVPQNMRAKAFALLGGMDSTGAVIGPILGLLFYFYFLSIGMPAVDVFRTLFIIAATPTIASIFIILLGTREIKVFNNHEDSGKPKKRKIPIRDTILVNKNLALFTFATSLLAFWALSENFMLALGANILNLQLTDVWPIILLYWSINITFAPVAFMSSKVSDKLGRSKPIALGMLSLAILTFGFMFAKEFLWFIPLFVLHGVYQGLFNPSQKAYVADVALPDRRSETLGTYSAIVKTVSIPGPIVFGLIWTYWGYQMAFFLSGLFVIIALIIFLTAVKMPKIEKTE